MADLKPRQYKRLGRIEESNPARAEKVADRMNKRSSREERGKVVARGTGGSILGAEGAIRGLTIEASRKNITTRRPDTPLATSPTPMYNSFKEAAILKKKNLNK